MSEDKKQVVVTINRVEFKGKWVEFWFTDSPEDMHNGSYNASSKSYKLIDAIERAGLYDEVMSNGLRGKRLKWEKIGNNYEIVDFVVPNESFLNQLISSQEDLEKRGLLTDIGVSYLNGLRQARKIAFGWTSTNEKENVENTSNVS